MRCVQFNSGLANAKRSAGFTVIELMLVVAIAAVLVSMGVPSFTSMLDRVELDTAGRELVSSLQGAREKAVTEGVAVTVEKNANVYVCTYTDENGVEQSCAAFPAHSSQVSVTPALSTINFNPDGRADPAVQFSIQHSEISDYSYVIRVRPSGRVSLQQI